MRRLTLCATAMAVATGAAAAPAYRLEAAVTIMGAAPAWDYLSVDPARDYVFVGRRKQGVTVYDAAARRVVGRIENSEGANMAALVPEFDRGYTANEDGSTTVFELSSLKTLERVKLGPAADAAVFEPSTGQLAFTLGDTKELVFVDARTAKVTGRVSMSSEELEGAVADGKGFLYVNERDKDRLAKVDARTFTRKAEWPTPGCHMPTGLAMDREHHRLFLGCKGAHPVVAVMDAATGKVVARLPIGRGNDGVVYDPGQHRVFASGGLDGNIVVYEQAGPDTYSLATAFTTRPIARTLALNARTGRIFTATAEGMVDPAKPRNTRAGPFYPNRYYDDTFTLLTYAPVEKAQ